DAACDRIQYFDWYCRRNTGKQGQPAVQYVYPDYQGTASSIKLSADIYRFAVHSSPHDRTFRRRSTLCHLLHNRGTGGKRYTGHSGLRWNYRLEDGPAE